jgi:hypothetical protein
VLGLALTLLIDRDGVVRAPLPGRHRSEGHREPAERTTYTAACAGIVANPAVVDSHTPPLPLGVCPGRNARFMLSFSGQAVPRVPRSTAPPSWDDRSCAT